ncbi:hypothetical protein [Pseudomonas sp. SO81]|uniref:hypothetical protein n=1 Tax=Pseudomonas sp. SO81 TaxID=2983246 RepID=UPI0025A35026|nr:hypothetical protein [Pseudomonas sp. SO81]WJN58283.1 hypothetical protein OH686_06025 [Pseudomonas sp. SO81]
MDHARITREESRLARLSAEAHQALIQFMNETALPYTAEQKAECEYLSRCAANARAAYLKLRRASSSSASRAIRNICSA